MSPWLVLAALNGLVSVMLGAYGWHALEVHESSQREIFQVGVQYHMWHALALCAVAWVVARAEDADPGAPRRAALLPARLAGIAFLLGIALFSGSLYVMGFTGAVPLDGLAPTGGVSLMAGWALLALAAWRGR